MTTTIETKTTNRLSWNITDTCMSVQCPDGTLSADMYYNTILGFEDVNIGGITFHLFKHGLKQKLADCVAGMTKNGVSYLEQVETIEAKWEEIRTGVVKVRKNAKVDPFAEARAKLAAMPEGKEKADAMKFAALLGIIK